jgi:alpha-ketoglutarate-dependent taurine dioxygenase
MKSNLERLMSAKAKPLDCENLIKIYPKNNTLQFPMVIESELLGMDLNNWFKQNKSQIDELIVSKGAVLFKNFNLKNKEDFAKFVKEVLDLKSLSYVNRTSPRYSVAENVYTSTTQPATEIIHFHSENSYSKNPPRYLIFYCDNPAQTGGETPLADNRIVLKNISTQLKYKFLVKGILYKRRVNESLGLGWKEIFQVETKFEVEKHCKENDIDFKWDGESLNLNWKGTAISNHLKTNEEIWMNHAFFFHKLSYSQTLLDVIESVDELPFLTSFGDGSEISEDEYFELKSAYDKAKIEFSWEKGDLLLVDNYLISHSRNSYTGDREILVSIF